MKKIGLGEPPSFFYSPRWSPDGKKIAYSDKRLQRSGTSTSRRRRRRSVDTDYYGGSARRRSTRPGRPTASGSPTRKPAEEPPARRLRLLAGAGQGLPGHRRHERRALSRPSTRTASTSTSPPAPTSGLAAAGLDMSSDEPAGDAQRLRRRAEQGPAVAARARERRGEGKDAKKADADKDKDAAEGRGHEGHGRGRTRTKAKDDDEGARRSRSSSRSTSTASASASSRCRSRRRTTSACSAARRASLFLAEGPPVIARRGRPEPDARRSRSSTSSKRKVEKLARRGQRLRGLVRTARRCSTARATQWVDRGDRRAAAADGTPKPGDGPLKLDDDAGLRRAAAEWRQMYHEAWRIERDFFYDPDFHGLDLGKAEKKYEPYLDGLASPRRPQLPLRGDARRADGRPHVRRRRRPARGRRR